MLSLCMILVLISTLPDVSAKSSREFGLVEAMSDGKEYVLVWNSELTDNSGAKHALGEEDGVFGATPLGRNISAEIF